MLIWYFTQMIEAIDHLIRSLPASGLALTIAVVIPLLAKSADWLVSQAVHVSFHWGVPRVVVGVTVVSLGTTSPEAAVSVVAAIDGQPGMALGNAVGSIICDTGLILGLACLLAPLKFDPAIVRRQGWIQLACGVLLVLACWPLSNPTSAFTLGGSLPQSMGIVFLMLLMVYMTWSVVTARRLGGDVETDAVGTPPHPSLAMALAALAASAALVVIVSSVFITAAEESATRLGVPPSVVAATLVAFGTSLPELIVVLVATWRGHGDLAIGNVVGADILNVLFVAGAAAAVTPGGLTADPTFFVLQFPAMLFVLVVFRVGILTARDGTLRRPFGVALLGAYLLVTVASYLVPGTQPLH